MPPTEPNEFFLDPRVVRRSFDTTAATFDAKAAVHAEIRARLMERLDVVRLVPSVVLDLGAGTGHAARTLQDRYSSARVLALDLSPGMLARAKKQQRLFRRFDRVAGAAEQLPLRDASVDLVFSNLMLQWCSRPDAVFAEVRRVLRRDGLVTFTTLGPDSLQELRQAWVRVDGHTHVHGFIDMHDLGDALMRAGFAEPVMDTERLTVTYRDPQTLLAELVGSGSANVAHGRRRGLVGRTARQRWIEAYEAARRDGVLPITLEVVYGHAWVAERGRKLTAPDGETRISVRDIGRRGR